MFRNPKQMGRWSIIAMAIGLVCSAEALAKKPVKPPKPPGGGDEKLSYSVIPLAEDPVFVDSFAGDINDLDQVVGMVRDVNDRVLAACWTTTGLDGQTPSSTLYKLTLFGGENGMGVANEVNDSGQIVGAGSAGGDWVGLYWQDFSAVPLELPPLEGHYESGATSSVDEAFVDIDMDPLDDELMEDLALTVL